MHIHVCMFFYFIAIFTQHIQTHLQPLCTCTMILYTVEVCSKTRCTLSLSAKPDSALLPAQPVATGTHTLLLTHTQARTHTPAHAHSSSQVLILQNPLFTFSHPSLLSSPLSSPALGVYRGQAEARRTVEIDSRVVPVERSSLSPLSAPIHSTPFQSQHPRSAPERDKTFMNPILLPLGKAWPPAVAPLHHHCLL